MARMETRGKPEDLPPLCRRRHLYLLGWSKREVQKLVEAGVLVEHRARAKARAFFVRTEILEVIYGRKD